MSVLSVESSDTLRWSSDYELNHEQIDEEHFHLFELINKLIASVARHDRWEFSAELAVQLAQQTRLHFDNEEAMMRAADYPRLDVHHEQHSELLSQVERLRDRLRDDHYLAQSHKALRFLNEWFSVHITRSDRLFVDFLKAAN
jgi:hemerythrin